MTNTEDNYRLEKIEARATTPKLRTITAAALATKKFPKVTAIVPGYIAPGLTLLAGRPKAGKSFLALNIAEAIASGDKVLGEQVDQGDVLYLALEDSDRRLQHRMNQLLPYGNEVKPTRLHFATECPALDKGGLDAIREWCESVESPRCVIVDVFTRVRGEKGRNESLYEHDYRTIRPLKELADKLGIAVIVIHHTSKRQNIDDPLDAVSGTTGLTGAADTILVLARGPQGATLYGRGRDIPEIETALRFDQERGQWAALGNAADVSRSAERTAIIDALRANNGPMSPTEIALDTGMKPGNVRFLLTKMTKAGEVTKEKRGHYSLAVDTGNNANNANNANNRSLNVSIVSTSNLSH
jgi:DNA-binding transcriptional ArsR family regulator